MTLGRSLLLTTMIVALFGLVAIPGQADETYYPSSWNGWWIYLSPSSQSNDGCTNDGYIEGPGQMEVALTVTNGAGTDLVARGYRVQLGNSSSLSTRISNSNTRWTTASPKMRHVALHSNAPGASTPSDCSWPYDINAPATGTDVYHWSSSSNGHALSFWLKERLKFSSPGTGDGKEESLHGRYDELSNTSAPAVIVEAAYHTFKLDVDWLKKPATWGPSGWAWRVGWGIDYALGYP
jgi:N-acetylmuramoyl-L-alanine amidase